MYIRTGNLFLVLCQTVSILLNVGVMEITFITRWESQTGNCQFHKGAQLFSIMLTLLQKCSIINCKKSSQRGRLAFPDLTTASWFVVSYLVSWTLSDCYWRAWTQEDNSSSPAQWLPVLPTEICSPISSTLKESLHSLFNNFSFLNSVFNFTSIYM